jgi:hypothetical protein
MQLRWIRERSQSAPDRLGALADRHKHRQGLERKRRTSTLKAFAVIEQKQDWLNLQLSKLRLIGWRIALTVVFFCLKETIRFLD